jgi:hypothetical protein
VYLAVEAPNVAVMVAVCCAVTAVTAMENSMLVVPCAIETDPVGTTFALLLVRLTASLAVAAAARLAEQESVPCEENELD